MEREELELSIIEAVCSEFGVEFHELRSPTRVRNIKDARHLAIFLLYFFTDSTITKVSKRFKRHHSTSLHAIKCVRNLIEYDRQYRIKYNRVISKIQSNVN